MYSVIVAILIWLFYAIVCREHIKTGSADDIISSQVLLLSGLPLPPPQSDYHALLRQELYEELEKKIDVKNHIYQTCRRTTRAGYNCIILPAGTNLYISNCGRPNREQAIELLRDSNAVLSCQLTNKFAAYSHAKRHYGIIIPFKLTRDAVFADLYDRSNVASIRNAILHWKKELFIGHPQANMLLQTAADLLQATTGINMSEKEQLNKLFETFHVKHVYKYTDAERGPINPINVAETGILQRAICRDILNTRVDGCVARHIPTNITSYAQPAEVYELTPNAYSALIVDTENALYAHDDIARGDAFAMREPPFDPQTADKSENYNFALLKHYWRHPSAPVLTNPRSGGIFYHCVDMFRSLNAREDDKFAFAREIELINAVSPDIIALSNCPHSNILWQLEQYLKKNCATSLIVPNNNFTSDHIAAHYMFLAVGTKEKCDPVVIDTDVDKEELRVDTQEGKITYRINERFYRQIQLNTARNKICLISAPYGYAQSTRESHNAYIDAANSRIRAAAFSAIIANNPNIICGEFNCAQNAPEMKVLLDAGYKVRANDQSMATNHKGTITSFTMYKDGVVGAQGIVSCNWSRYLPLIQSI